MKTMDEEKKFFWDRKTRCGQSCREVAQALPVDFSGKRNVYALHWFAELKGGQTRMKGSQ